MRVYPTNFDGRKAQLFSIIALLTSCLGSQQLQAQGGAWASTEYLSYSSYYYKTTHTSASGSQNISTTYSTGSVSQSNGFSSSRTRTNLNGVVTTMYGFWIQTHDNYSATPNFQVPGANGSTYTSTERHRATFAVDYENPSNSGVTIDVDIQASLETVDSVGNVTGTTDASREKSDIQPGNSGSLRLRPPSGTRTSGVSAGGMFYSINLN